MRLPGIMIVGLALLLSEIALVFTKRAKTRANGKDRATLPLLWIMIGLSIFAGFFCRSAFPQGRLPHPRLFYLIGLLLLVLGLVLRWMAIIHLGRFFTVNVAIAKDHRLITTGPYRYLRHPSYTGTLLVFLGFSLCMLNVFALAVVFLPITAAFLWRIQVEEEALRNAFGERYRTYAASTYRLVPYLF